MQYSEDKINKLLVEISSHRKAIHDSYGWAPVIPPHLALPILDMLEEYLLKKKESA